MGERKAQNKYYPPDFDPEVHGTLNAYHHHHPLGYRARKLRTEGVIIMRFEMPFNAWCDTCHTHIPRGARFNADQKHVGNYFSTKIYSFTMRCPCCGCQFVIETDPANADYRLTAGATRKTEEWSQESSEGYALESDATKERRRTDVMFRMEKQHDDVEKAKTLRKGLIEAARAQKSTTADDYLANSLARKIMRTQREEEQHFKDECRSMGLTTLKKLQPATRSDMVEVEKAHREQESIQLDQQWRTKVFSAVCSDAFTSSSSERAFAVVAANMKPQSTSNMSHVDDDNHSISLSAPSKPRPTIVTNSTVRSSTTVSSSSFSSDSSSSDGRNLGTPAAKRRKTQIVLPTKIDL